ncbi:conserved hypothetical protein [Verticillium alfalfae VaMs.102]|uniref:Uncharacterized protein n=1 Tax=Verticillium alfalfae (strain VaMs.102 / ATCC MYA-4576 / FGSC 10136) TaxID=526221 RepID=C9S8Z4_VERA1|nr:conserved hypothetical protein [Verticillium alfalfae VaMs.102]EEY14967.1 conserved hypothetical protein [Verticillium alfalfae VaMs.102]
MADKDGLQYKPLNVKLHLLKSPLKEDDASSDTLSVGLQTLIPTVVKPWSYRYQLKEEPVFSRNNEATNLEVFYDLFLAAAAFILMVSRLCLALEYGMVLLHVRHYTKARVPLLVLVVSSSVAAFIYFGLAFLFDRAHSSIFYMWYGIAFFEVASNAVLSTFYSILSFQDTHLIRRISLLTLIIFGEGVAIACDSVTSVVESGHNAWSASRLPRMTPYSIRAQLTSGAAPKTIGVVTAAVSTIYLVFMVYFDWMCRFHLPRWRQLAWTLLHFPLHLCMTLFMEGAAQFIVVWKIAEGELSLLTGFNHMVKTSAVVELTDSLWNFTSNFTKQYPVTHCWSQIAINSSFDAMRDIDLVQLQEHLQTASQEEIDTDPNLAAWGQAAAEVIRTLDNLLLQAFDIDFTKEATREHAGIKARYIGDTTALNMEVGKRASKRFRTLFQYTFVCAGAFLALSNVLYCIAYMGRWTRWAKVRVTLNFVIAAGIALVACVSQDAEYFNNYNKKPFVLMTMLMPYVVVLVLNHLPHSLSVFGLPGFPWWKRLGRDVEVTPPMELIQTTHYDPREHFLGPPDSVVVLGQPYAVPQQPRSVSAAQGPYEAVEQTEEDEQFYRGYRQEQ